MYFRYEMDFGSEEVGVMKNWDPNRVGLLVFFRSFQVRKYTTEIWQNIFFHISGLQHEDCEF